MADEEQVVDAPAEPVESAPVAETPTEPVAEAASQPEAEPNYWEHFKGLPQFEGQSDRDIASHLYQSMEREKSASQALAQYQQVLPYAQDFLANRADYEKWKEQAAQQQQQSNQAAQEVKKAWQPPEVKDSFRRYLTKDENGRDTITDDAPLEARQQLMEHLNYRADFAQKFLDNPEETLGPMIQQMAQAQAQEMIQQTLNQRDDQSFVEHVQEENRDWLIDAETGNVTPEGLLVHKKIEEARSLGINGPQARWQYAVAMAERDMLAQRFEQQSQNEQQFVQQMQAEMQQPQQEAPPPQAEPEPAAPQPDQAQQNMEYLRREASRNPSRSAGQAINNGEQPKKPSGNFSQMLKEQLASKGLI